MRRVPLDQNTVVQLNDRCRRLQVVQGLSLEEAASLLRHAGKIFESRVQLQPPLPSILVGPETWGEGLTTLLNAILDQACMDAARAFYSRR